MKYVVVFIAALAITARAQIPSLGFCPEYLPMPDFNMERFTGIWYEAERYFQLTEVASRCVMSNYTKFSESSSKYHVINEVTSRFTGIKRVFEGEIRRSPLKSEAGKFHVKYTTVPLIPLETQYNVLETDYDTYAVLWSCSGLGLVRTQNAWIMTRQRLAPGEILQRAYGVLDKYKISKVFFVKTNQEDCAHLDSLQEASEPTEPPKKKVTTPAPEVAQESVEEEAEEQPQPLDGKSVPEIRQHIIPDAPEAIVKFHEAKPVVLEEAAVTEPIAEESKSIETVAEIVQSVPEVIMKVADQTKKLQEIALKPADEKPTKEQLVIAAPATVEEPKEIAPVVEEVQQKLETEQPKEIIEETIEIVKP